LENSFEIEKNCFFCGEEVIGIVHLKIEEFLDRPVLMLGFKGEEKAQWTESGSCGDDSDIPSSQVKTVTKKCPVLSIRKELYSWKDGLKPGHYSIPFAYSSLLKYQVHSNMAYFL
jgi:hypothetical protein